VSGRGSEEPDAYLARWARGVRRVLRPDGDRAGGDAAVEVRPLMADNAADFLAFFDHHAHPDGHEWDGCYCYYDRFPGPADAFDPSDGDGNRGRMQRQLRAGMVRGWLAYEGGRPVGWLHATSRVELPHLKVPAPLPGPGERVGVLACFTVAPSHRRRGVAARLLRAALDAFTSQGFTLVEAYPPKAPRSPASSYRGWVGLYEAAGFDLVDELEHHLVARKRLRPR
jgi:ribosomal protein S18 acetylase RimI-like enzyme